MGAGERAETAGSRALDVFLTALGLGMTSFGGPIAHIGYFERVYVRKRGWLSEEEFAGIVALCQTIPGPTSSQAGWLIGLKRAGWPGAIAAWLGFTLPSALLMFGFAVLAPKLIGPTALAVLHGLKLAAVAVVAQAVWSMARRLTPDVPRAAIAVGAAVILLMVTSATAQVLALTLGALVGVFVCRNLSAAPTAPNLPVGPRTGAMALALFLILLLVLPVAAQGQGHRPLALAAIFYRAGALVFGGGQVILPLLRGALVPPGWLADAPFLAGYGAALAVPGPLSSFAAYLGAVVAPGGASLGVRALWAVSALGFIYLPGLLIAVAGAPVWTWFSGHRLARGALGGVNSAVVGVLAAALYNPIWKSSVASPLDVAIAAVGFLVFERFRAPPILVVILCVVASTAAAFVGR
ncbi:MAG TPA: chromate efflux transporter [Caulobacteraceae bacterium]|jgi:chromate transporter